MTARIQLCILLLLSLTWAPAQGEVRVPADLGCMNVLPQIIPPLEVPLAEVKVEPFFYAGNTPELLGALKTKGKIQFKLSHFNEGSGLEKLCSVDFGCFVVVEKTPKWSLSKKSFVLKGSDGKWFEVPGTHGFLAGGKNARFELDFSRFKYLPSTKETFTAELSKIRERYHHEFFDENNAQELGDYLSSKQLGNSTNLKAAKDEAKKAFISAIREANQDLAAKVISGDPIDRKLLGRINFLANDGINPYGKAANAKLAGVLRGTSEQVKNAEGALEAVDMTKFKVIQVEDDGSVLNEFMHPSDVPAAVDHWLERVNHLNSNSDAEEVFALYKELVEIHPFADGNGRTSRMMLNYMLLKAKLVPLEFPAHSLFFRPEDILRKYVQGFKEAPLGEGYFHLSSFSSVKDMDGLAAKVQKDFNLEKVTIEHLHGTSGYIFVGTHKGRFIQFESTNYGVDLSDSLGAMVSRSMKIIDQQEALAKVMGTAPPTYAIYPELLEQKGNYHQIYEATYGLKQFESIHHHPPSASDLYAIGKKANQAYRDILTSSSHAKTDREFLDIMMKTPKIPVQAKTVEDVTNHIMEIVAPEFKERIRKAMIEKSSEGMKQSFVDVYNAFNSPKFDSFMSDVAEDALIRCRKAGVCGPNQRSGIPDKFLAEVLKDSADQLGIPTETISRFVGREPGRLYFQRIQRGSLIFDDGAPGNHGMMPHALQNLFIYRQLGKERTQSFFKEMTGWVYERMLDSNAAFTAIPSTRDITRRHYWTGIFKAGNRSEVSKMGELIGEEGRYSGFVRDHKLELVGVEEKMDKDLLNAGSVVRARYKGKEFTFNIDRDGVPEADAAKITEAFKKQMDEAK